ncbi:MULTISPECIES: heat shock protein HspQ [unclassified Bradyrhizobium]|uniref:heat shock protein HspQ n=1 Tax=unclassified Bradyrhizobium TaxID=2631580 RepID=UPI0028F09146|nr:MULTISPECIES: heat shock protein HspQ [unclassified Bradyrhizobium]
MVRMEAKFTIGQVIRHRVYDLRGVVFDVDLSFSEEEGWRAITMDTRLDKEQPFYYLLAECGDSSYIAYVPEQNLVADVTGEPVKHPDIGELFDVDDAGSYRYRGRVFQ